MNARLSKYKLVVRIALCLLIAALAACTASSNENTRQPASQPVQAPISTATSPLASSAAVTQTIAPTFPAPASPTPGLPPAEKFSIPGEEGVVFPGSAGLEISGTFWPGEGSTPRPGVLLLHMAYRERGDWRGLAGRLTHAGFAVLAIDLRGHGKTGGEIVWEAMPEDVQAAWKYLAGRPEVDPQRTFVIGASAGANLALLLGAAEPSITGVALLSASLDFFGLATGEAVKAYGKRPLLIVASQGDTYSAEGSRELARLAKGDVALKIYDGAVHGTDLLSSQPELESFLLEWLKKKAND